MATPVPNTPRQSICCCCCRFTSLPIRRLSTPVVCSTPPRSVLPFCQRTVCVRFLSAAPHKHSDAVAMCCFAAVLRAFTLFYSDRGRCHDLCSQSSGKNVPRNLALRESMGYTEESHALSKSPWCVVRLASSNTPMHKLVRHLKANGGAALKWAVSEWALKGLVRLSLIVLCYASHVFTNQRLSVLVRNARCEFYPGTLAHRAGLASLASIGRFTSQSFTCAETYFNVRARARLHLIIHLSTNATFFTFGTCVNQVWHWWRSRDRI